MASKVRKRAQSRGRTRDKSKSRHPRSCWRAGECEDHPGSRWRNGTRLSQGPSLRRRRLLLERTPSTATASSRPPPPRTSPAGADLPSASMDAALSSPFYSSLSFESLLPGLFKAPSQSPVEPEPQSPRTQLAVGDTASRRSPDLATGASRRPSSSTTPGAGEGMAKKRNGQRQSKHAKLKVRQLSPSARSPPHPPPPPPHHPTLLPRAHTELRGVR